MNTSILNLQKDVDKFSATTNLININFTEYVLSVGHHSCGVNRNKVSV